MDTVCDTLPESLRVDFDLARLELAEALASRAAKDTPAARAWVDRCRARLDRVLDMWLEAHATLRR
jgi:hypothetical protein